MTTMQDFPLVGSYNNQRVSSIDAERSINLFEYRDSLGKKPATLISTSGLQNSGVVFLGTGGGFRAQFLYNGLGFHVIGTDVWLTNNMLVPTKINTSPLFISANGYVGIDANQNNQVIFVDGRNGFIYNTVTTQFEQITDQGFTTSPIDVCFIDGFFLVASGGTPNFQLSTLNQGLVWSGVTGNFDTFTLAALSSNVILTSGTTLNYQIGTPVTVSSSTVAEIPNGNYFVVAVVSGTVIRVSSTLNGAPISSVAGGAGDVSNNGQLQQASITSHPGNIVGCRTLHRRVFLFSNFFIEVWENAGLGTNLPLRRNNSFLLEYGTPAVGSISVSFDRMFFLSQDRDGLGAVMEVAGTTAIPVSTRALDFQLAQYAGIPTTPIPGQGVADTRSILIKENGIIFYRLNFTIANHTFVYNVTQSNPESDETKFWHEEQVLNGNRHPAQTHIFINGLNYVGSYIEPIMYLLDSSLIDNDGDAIPRIRISKAIVPPGYNRMRIDRFQVDLLQGSIFEITENGIEYDLITESGSFILTEDGLDIITENSDDIALNTNPIVFLSISKDGGQSYGNQIIAPMGTIGERTFRTVWRKLGTIPRGQAFVVKIQFYNTVPFIVLGAAWATEVMPE